MGKNGRSNIQKVEPKLSPIESSLYCDISLVINICTLFDDPSNKTGCVKEANCCIHIVYWVDISVCVGTVLNDTLMSADCEQIHKDRPGAAPGKILTLSEPALDEIEAGLQTPTVEQLDTTIRAIIHAVSSANAAKLEQLLRLQYQGQGMRNFILQTVVPLLHTVGELWAGSRLQIFQEHFLSQQLIRFLNVEITQIQIQAKKPLVLLATLPGEDHSLGLLMVAGILSDHGVATINLASNVPMDQIESAMQQFHADIVGITFSGAYPYKNVRPHINELRTLINDDVDIWVGGEGVHRLRKLPSGISKFTTLEKLPI